MSSSLTQLERAVIALARNDPASSLKRPGRTARWLRGSSFAPLPLANPRLEALRRYAILRRVLGGGLAHQERENLFNSGFARGLIEEIDDLTAETGPRDRPSDLARHLASSPAPAIPQSITAGSNMQNSSPMRARLMMVAAALPFILWHGIAQAQTEPPVNPAVAAPPPEGPPDGQGGPDGPGGPGGPDGDRFAIGVGGIYQPAYMGSDKYRFQPLPAIDIKYGRFFANFQNGIGANLIDGETVTIGAGVVMADNYRAKDVPNGIGKLKFGAGARGFVSLRQFGFEATAGVTKIFVGGTGGTVADFSLSRPIMVNERLFLNPSIGTTWGDRKNNNRYFGVNAQQSLASGLPQFRTGSGLLNAKAELGLQYRLTDHIGLGLVGGVTTLLGDVKDSPIVKKKTAPFGIGFISYQF